MYTYDRAEYHCICTYCKLQKYSVCIVMLPSVILQLSKFIVSRAPVRTIIGAN